MATIIAARLQLQDQVEKTINELVTVGFAREDIAHFYVNPPGQHATYPIGGDRYESPGAKESGKGAAKGGVAAAAAGAALGAGLSPAGAVIGGLVGAHAGSLIGSLLHAKEKGESEQVGVEDSSDTDNTDIRRAGLLVAVKVSNRAGEESALSVFRRCAAAKLEKSEGEIVDGEWRDFDPLSAPQYL